MSEVRPPVAARRRLWKRKRFLFPAATLLILATTAAGAVALWSGDDDVTIPVTYTTDTGVTINCIFGFSAHSSYLMDGTLLAMPADVAALREFFQKNDWTDIGQKAYQKAINDSWVPEGGAPNDARLNRALTEVVSKQIPESLFREGIAWTTGSDCSGQLH